LKRLCEAAEFRAGRFDTGFIDRNLDLLGAINTPAGEAVIAAGALYLVQREAERIRSNTQSRVDDLHGAWSLPDGFQLLGHREAGLPVSVEGEASVVRVAWDRGGPSIRSNIETDEDFTIVDADRAVIVLNEGRQIRVALQDPFDVDLEHMDEGNAIKAPMHGKLVAVFVRPGDRVEKGQRLAIVEAMKMEHVLTASFDGTVAEVTAEPGAQVAEGARLIVIETEETTNA
jgi:3-methylcrotonyl-CoA carboxylase alpha subunit